MEKRVYGLENEYGVIDLTESRFGEVGNLGILFEIIFQSIARFDRLNYRHGFCRNGGLIYLEPAGSHPEYATPECASIRDLVKWDKAGERILEEALSKFNAMAVAEGLPESQIRLYKNNVDATGSATFGCHENYLVQRRIDEIYLHACLIPFLVSRQIFCGSGRVSASGFNISQRAPFIGNVLDLSSTTSRPIIHLKDEVWAAKEKWRRLHLILGDANMSEVSTFLKVGTTALVLRMIEDEFLSINKIKLAEPVEDLKAVSLDPGLSRKLRLSRSFDGYAELSAVEIQRIYLELAKEYLALIEDAEPEWHEIVVRWEHVLNVLKEDPMRLFRQVDWVAKKWMMESVLQRYGWDWNKLKAEADTSEGQRVLEHLQIIDLQYHDIRRDAGLMDRGLYYILEKEGLAERLVGEEEIHQAKTEAPSDTRAKWRADFMKLMEQDERFENIRCQVTSWDTITLVPTKARVGEIRTMDFEIAKSLHRCKCFGNGDPFNNQLPPPEEILEKLRSV